MRSDRVSRRAGNGNSALLGVAVTLYCVAAATTAGAAGVYRWVDGSGTVHYSDQPHANARPINVKPVPGGAAAGTHPKAHSQDANAAADSGPSRRERVAAIRAQQCSKARQRLAKYRKAARLTTTGADGKQHELSADERVQAIAHAQEDVTGLCGGPANDNTGP